MSRTDNVLKNIKYVLCAQVLSMMVVFISRSVLIQALGNEYVGINGLLSNILSVLSFAELGIGTSIICNMYKPLAQNDIRKLKALMCFYRQAYSVIGMFILIAGLCITPWIKFFVNGTPTIPYLNLIYMLYVMNIGLSYFFSYKKSLIIADQKSYMTTVYHYSFVLICNTLQIIFLVLFRNFILYLIIQVLCTFMENILISIKADKLYPFLKQRDGEELFYEDKKKIIKNTQALILHKIGGIVVNSTDNIILSKFTSLIIVGIYSNYVLILNSLNSIISLIFQSFTASIGNLVANEDTFAQEKTFRNINFIGFWIYGFCSICLFNLLNPFICLWIGKENMLPLKTIFLITFNFFLTGMRKSVLTFRDAVGLYWPDRYKPLVESIINLLFSIILVNRLGINGVLIGTMVSTLSTCFWIEPHVLYKYAFRMSANKYFIYYVYYILALVCAGLGTFLVVNLVNSNGIGAFFVKMGLCGLVPNLIFMPFLYKTQEFNSLIRILFRNHH